MKINGIEYKNIDGMLCMWLPKHQCYQLNPCELITREALEEALRRFQCQRENVKDVEQLKE